MKNCSCTKLDNGVSDVYGFGYETKNRLVVKLNGADALELCECACKMKRNEIWFVDSDAPRVVAGLENKFLTTLAAFGKTGRLLKGK